MEAVRTIGYDHSFFPPKKITSGNVDDKILHWGRTGKALKIVYTQMHHGKEFRFEFDGMANGWAFSRIFGPNGAISSLHHDNPYNHIIELGDFCKTVQSGGYSTYVSH